MTKKPTRRTLLPPHHPQACPENGQDTHNRMTGTNTNPAIGGTPYLVRKHTNGDYEIILCAAGKTLRFYGSDEDSAFKRAARYLSTLTRR